MSRYSALREGAKKPEYMKHAAFAALRPHVERVIDAGESIANKRAALAKDEGLSEIGRATQLKDIAGLHAPDVGKAARMLAKAQEANKAKRTALAPTVKDPANVAEALIRAEYRALLRTKSPAEAIGIVFSENAPRSLIESVLEGGVLLHGIPAKQVEELRNAVAERTGGPAMAALREESQALDFAQAVVDDARGSLGDSAGFNRIGSGVLPPAFAAWFATAAGPPDEAGDSADFAKAAAESLLANAKALDYEARKAIVDGLLNQQITTLKADAA